MQITVTTDSGNVLPFEVSLELTLQELKAILEIDVAISASQMVLLHNMEAMKEDGRSLKDYKVQEGDIIMVRQGHTPDHAQSSANQSQSQGATVQTTPPAQREDPNDPDVIRRHLLTHPSELALLRERNPPLAEALDSGSPQLFREALQTYRRHVAKVEQERIRLLNANPMDPNVQAKIAQDIQQRNIQENMEAAIEFTPENFGRVVMLYIPIKVNGIVVNALVDSGAASTIMSETCAERCGVMRLVDRRFATVAIGVGTQKVIGKVHLSTVQIGGDMLTASFQVLQSQTEDMLLGLDMLRRHQCCIDLVKNVLRIGTTGTEAPFLTEAELKDKEEAKLAMKQKQIMENEDAEIARVVASSQKDVAASVDQQSPAKVPRLSPRSSSQSSSNQSTSSIAHDPIQSRPVPTHVPASTPARQQEFPENDIAQVVSAGFSREQALETLRMCGGNVDLALGSLLF